jgi:radical SAM protein with 4Fe4S-binding SPASM domain
MRYLIREELNGAFVFDREERYVFTLSKNEFTQLLDLNYNPKSVEILPANLQQRHFFIDNQINFETIMLPPEIAMVKDVCHLVAPNRLYLELTRACNLRCLMCYNAGGRPLPNELNTDEWFSVLDQMAEAGVFEARLTGGESTIRADFLEILDYALAKDFYVSLATNGIWTEELKSEICQRPIDDVIVSLDGPPEINDRFRIGGSFKETLSTIIALKQAGIKKIRINTVLSKLNWQSVEPLFAICEQYDLLLIDFIHPRPFGRGADNKSIMLSAEETYAFNRLVEKLRKKYPSVKVIMDFDLLAEQEPQRHPIVPRIHACPAGREFAFVSPQGYVFPCGVAPVHDINKILDEERELFIAGSLKKNSLLEIWQQSKVWQAYRNLPECKPPKCFVCKFWGKRCFGTCPVGAYYANGKLNGEDPYCFSHLLPEDNI